jgi:hypothetical protein
MLFILGTGKMPLQKILPQHPAEPLWQRVPTRTDSGELVADFMMIITGVKQLNPVARKSVYDRLYGVLNIYEKVILLAEVNMRIHTLWVSHKPRPGLGTEIASMIHHHVPQAKLISQKFI